MNAPISTSAPGEPSNLDEQLGLVLEGLGIDQAEHLINALRPSESQLRRAHMFARQLENRRLFRAARTLRDIIARREEQPTFAALIAHYWQKGTHS